ncbi:DUF4340 domain-containing protein [Thermodesulfobacteriota bacterium]
MKAKKEYFILAVIIVALALYLVFHKTDRTHYQLPDISMISSKDISKLEINRSDVSILLNKKSDDWFIGEEEYLADPDKSKDMLEVIEDLTMTALVSESKNYVRYDLGDDKKLAVKAWDGSSLKRDFEIGKSANTFRHTFVRMAGDPNVYHARGNFRATFDQTIDKLRDKSVLSFEQSEIQEIQVTEDKSLLVAVQKGAPTIDLQMNEKAAEAPQAEAPQPIWQDADAKGLDKSKVESLLSPLSELKCEAYIYDRKKDDFKEPTYLIRLKGAEEYTLSIFAKIKEDDNKYPAITSQNNFPFYLPGFRVDNLKKNTEELFKGKEKS